MVVSGSLWQSVLVFRSLLQFAAVSGSLLQSVLVFGSLLQFMSMTILKLSLTKLRRVVVVTFRKLSLTSGQ